jgi:hypothetical protein
LQHPVVTFYNPYLSYWSTIAEPESIIGYCKGGANPKKKLKPLLFQAIYSAQVKLKEIQGGE